MSWKWIGVIALFVIGIVAAVVAIFWLAVPIHSLPAIIGGKHGRGHYRRRGEGLIVLAVVLLGVATYLTIRFRRDDAAAAGGPALSNATTGSSVAPTTAAGGTAATAPAAAAPQTAAPDAPVENP